MTSERWRQVEALRLLSFPSLRLPAVTKRALVFFLFWAAASAQETVESVQVKSGGATIEVTFAPGKFYVPRASLLAWISNAANAVSEYFGRFRCRMRGSW
jgi:hypothetical protein